MIVDVRGVRLIFEAYSDTLPNGEVFGDMPMLAATIDSVRIE